MLIFVYGTLKKQYEQLNVCTKEFHRHTEWLCNGSVRGEIYLMDWYPALKLKGQHVVQGEIYTIHSPILLQGMDAYEGACTEEEYGKLDSINKASIEYLRKRISVEGMECWVYEYIGEVDVSKHIESGVFEME